MEFQSDLLMIFTVHNENPKYDILHILAGIVESLTRLESRFLMTRT